MSNNREFLVLKKIGSIFFEGRNPQGGGGLDDRVSGNTKVSYFKKTGCEFKKTAVNKVSVKGTPGCSEGLYPKCSFTPLEITPS